MIQCVDEVHGKFLRVLNLKSFAQVKTRCRPKAEAMVRQVLIDSQIYYMEVPNEAAFYGPKIDVQVWSVIGREFIHQPIF